MYRISEGLGEIKGLFIYSLLAFIIIGLISTFFFMGQEELVDKIMTAFIEEKSDIFIEDEPHYNAEGELDTSAIKISVKGLFINNLRASVTSNLLGLIPFIFLPALVLVINAVLVGTVFAMPSLGLGPSGLKLLVGGILPHGIFEIPALLISISMGLFLCRQISKKLLRRSHEPIVRLFIRQLLVTLFVVTPLLLIAAVVESKITPLIMELML